MVKEVQKARTHAEDLDLDEPLLSLESDEHIQRRREKSIARIRLLWDRRSFLARAAGFALAAATIIVFLIPNSYTSTTRLMPPNEGGETGMAMLASLATKAGTIGGLGSQLLGLKTTGDLFIGVLKSDTVRDDIVKRFGLLKVYRDRYLEDGRNDLAKHTGISEDTKSGIITLSVTDHSAERSTEIAKEYVNELNWVVNNLSTSSAHRERVFLDQRLDQVKSNLEADEKQFSEFASQKGALDIAEQGKAMLTAAAGLQGELIAAESELQGLRQIYTDNNVRVRSLQARVNDLHGALQKIGGKGTDENSSAQEIYPSLRQLPLLGVQYADLLRRTKVQEAVFEALTQEDELAKVEEAKETPSVRVLDPPEVPEKNPPRLVCQSSFSVRFLLWHSERLGFLAVRHGLPSISMTRERL